MSSVFGFMSCYVSWRSRQMIARVLGRPYQKAGATVRGASRPAQNLPTAGVETPLELKT